MYDILKTDSLDIPEGVKVSIKARVVEVVGPRGTLVRNVKHVNIDMRVLGGKKPKVTLAVWQAGRKHIACLRTIRSMINNMIIGVTKGFRYKMRIVYAHFAMTWTAEGRTVTIKTYLGDKYERKIELHEGVTITDSKAVKEEIILEGNDIEAVSQSAASIQQICKVRHKDIRKFLDGIYVSEKGTIISAD